MSINIFGVSCDVVTCPDGELGAMGAQGKFCNEVNLSQLESLILQHPVDGTPIDNWGASMTALDFQIDNADATDVKQKQIFGVGSVPEPTIDEIETNGFQMTKIKGVYAISFRLYTFDAVTYDYLRKLQCGTVKPKIYYTTEGGYIYGKNGGIDTTKFQVELIQEEGSSAVEYFQFNIEFNSKTAPDRYLNPLAV